MHNSSEIRKISNPEPVEGLNYIITRGKTPGHRLTIHSQPQGG